MGYNRKSYIETRDLFKKREDKAKNDAYIRKAEVQASIPEIREIETLLASTSAEIAIEIAKGKENIEERINVIRDKNLALQAKKAELLRANGYPDDYTKIKYICPKCEDTGFIGTEMCECFRSELIKTSIRNSGIGGLVDSQTLDNFDLKYYADDPMNLKMMKNLLESIREYISDFDSNSANLMFIGATGLGKTHISTAIACAVIERGFDVVYDSAQNILGDFEYERFGRGYNTDADEIRTEKYFDCDLLIIDDLGAELSNNFTISCFYNLINSRINSQKPMIISTNLMPSELEARYEKRISSRLLGEFALMMFKGTDIRQQKLKLF